jgi:hypothetical protein
MVWRGRNLPRVESLLTVGRELKGSSRAYHIRSLPVAAASPAARNAALASPPWPRRGYWPRSRFRDGGQPDLGLRGNRPGVRVRMERQTY